MTQLLLQSCTHTLAHIHIQKAEHLQMSCHMLLQALDSCGYHIRGILMSDGTLRSFL